MTELRNRAKLISFDGVVFESLGRFGGVLGIV